MTRIKVCGITRANDAEDASAEGVDALGLVFWENSPRAVETRRAREIAAVVAPFVTLVGLFVDASREEVERVLDDVPLDLLQFHGNESAAFCESFGRPYIKAIRVKADVDLSQVTQEYTTARGLLLDAWHGESPGGTGRVFDWRLADTRLPRPLILAGGLTPDNVGEAIDLLAPAAVDVSSGVESGPGLKDAERIRRFVAAVRASTGERRDRAPVQGMAN